MTIDYSRARVEFNKNGYVLIRKFFDPDHIKSIRRDVSNADFLSLGCDTYFESIGDTTTLKRVERFHNKFQPLSDLLRNKQYLALLETLLGEAPCLFKDKINFKSSGGSGFELHVDGHFFWQTQENGSKYWGWRHYAKSFVNAVIPLEPATRENGALQIAEKNTTFKFLGDDWSTITNKLDGDGPFLNQTTSEKIHTETIEMDVGDILIFDWMCIHGSRTNNSLSGRPILYVTYNGLSDGENELKYFNDKSLSLASGDAKTLTR